MRGAKILDILLLPKSLYGRITDRSSTLILGIILIGLLDLGFSLFDKIKQLFSGKTQSVLFYNVTLTIIAVIVIGLIHVLFFARPIFDLYKRFKKEKDVPDGNSQLIKIMKIYIVANLIILPVNILFNYIVSRMGDINNPAYRDIILYSYIIISVWFCAAVTRGINAIYSFTPNYRRLVFPSVFLWDFLLSFALQFIISHLLMTLYK